MNKCKTCENYTELTNQVCSVCTDKKEEKQFLDNCMIKAMNGIITGLKGGVQKTKFIVRDSSNIAKAMIVERRKAHKELFDNQKYYE